MFADSATATEICVASEFPDFQTGSASATGSLGAWPQAKAIGWCIAEIAWEAQGCVESFLARLGEGIS